MNPPVSTAVIKPLIGKAAPAGKGGGFIPGPEMLTGLFNPVEKSSVAPSFGGVGFGVLPLGTFVHTVKMR